MSRVRSLGPSRRARSSGVFLVVLLLAGVAEAQARLAPVLGVELGAPTAELERVLPAQGLSCRRSFEAQGQAIVCTGRMGSAPFPAVTTYWLRDGQVERVYQQAQVSFSLWAQYVRALELWRIHLEAALGQPAVSGERPLPAWAQALDDGERRRALAEGRLGLEVGWPPAVGARVTLALRGEQGRPRLVLAAEPLPPAAAASATGAAAAATRRRCDGGLGDGRARWRQRRAAGARRTR